MSAAIGHAVLAPGVRRSVVCGHSDRGAMKALLEPRTHGLDAMPAVSRWLRNAEARRAATAALHPGAAGGEAVAALAHQNVPLQLGHLRTHPAVAARLCDIAAGTVRVFDSRTRETVAVDGAPAALRAEAAAG